MDRKQVSVAAVLVVLLSCGSATSALADADLSNEATGSTGLCVQDKSVKLVVDDATTIAKVKTVPGKDICFEFDMKANGLDAGKLLYIDDTPWNEFFGKLNKNTIYNMNVVDKATMHVDEQIPYRCWKTYEKPAPVVKEPVFDSATKKKSVECESASKIVDGINYRAKCIKRGGAFYINEIPFDKFDLSSITDTGTYKCWEISDKSTMHVDYVWTYTTPNSGDIEVPVNPDTPVVPDTPFKDEQTQTRPATYFDAEQLRSELEQFMTFGFDIYVNEIEYSQFKDPILADKQYEIWYVNKETMHIDNVCYATCQMSDEEPETPEGPFKDEQTIDMGLQQVADDFQIRMAIDMSFGTVVYFNGELVEDSDSLEILSGVECEVWFVNGQTQHIDRCANYICFESKDDPVTPDKPFIDDESDISKTPALMKGAKQLRKIINDAISNGMLVYVDEVAYDNFDGKFLADETYVIWFVNPETMHVERGGMFFIMDSDEDGPIYGIETEEKEIKFSTVEQLEKQLREFSEKREKFGGEVWVEGVRYKDFNSKFEAGKQYKVESIRDSKTMVVDCVYTCTIRPLDPSVEDAPFEDGDTKHTKDANGSNTDMRNYLDNKSYYLGQQGIEVYVNGDVWSEFKEGSISADTTYVIWFVDSATNHIDEVFNYNVGESDEADKPVEPVDPAGEPQEYEGTLKLSNVFNSISEANEVFGFFSSMLSKDPAANIELIVNGIKTDINSFSFTLGEVYDLQFINATKNLIEISWHTEALDECGLERFDSVEDVAKYINNINKGADAKGNYTEINGVKYSEFDMNSIEEELVYLVVVRNSQTKGAVSALRVSATELEKKTMTVEEAELFFDELKSSVNESQVLVIDNTMPEKFEGFEVGRTYEISLGTRNVDNQLYFDLTHYNRCIEIVVVDTTEPEKPVVPDTPFEDDDTVIRTGIKASNKDFRFELKMLYNNLKSNEKLFVDGVEYSKFTSPVVADRHYTITLVNTDTMHVDKKYVWSVIKSNETSLWEDDKTEHFDKVCESADQWKPQFKAMAEKAHESGIDIYIGDTKFEGKFKWEHNSVYKVKFVNPDSGYIYYTINLTILEAAPAVPEDMIETMTFERLDELKTFLASVKYVITNEGLNQYIQVDGVAFENLPEKYYEHNKIVFVVIRDADTHEAIKAVKAVSVDKIFEKKNKSEVEAYLQELIDGLQERQVLYLDGELYATEDGVVAKNSSRSAKQVSEKHEVDIYTLCKTEGSIKKHNLHVTLYVFDDPVDPVEPVEPTDPVGPVEPVDPTDPVSPVDPTDPVDPVGPVDPTDPVDPVDPSEPENPGDNGDNGDNDESGKTDAGNKSEEAKPVVVETSDPSSAFGATLLGSAVLFVMSYINKKRFN